jgi:hypothetical protein
MPAFDFILYRVMKAGRPIIFLIDAWFVRELVKGCLTNQAVASAPIAIRADRHTYGLAPFDRLIIPNNVVSSANVLTNRGLT